MGVTKSQQRSSCVMGTGAARMQRALVGWTSPDRGWRAGASG